MDPRDDLPSLPVLGKEIREFREKNAPRAARRASDADGAMRMGVELSSGVLVGIGVGIVLDRWLDTSPFLLITCFLLGAGASGMLLYRLVRAPSAALSDDDETNARELKDK